MKICENKRSRLLTINQGPSYDDSFKHLLKSPGPVVTIFLELRENSLGHMTNIAAKPVHGKNI